MISVIITGATGMVGKGVLLECIERKEVERVLLINRSKIDIVDPKIKEIIHDDFTDFSKIEDELRGYDACFFCLGVSAGAMSANTYKIITYDYTIALATTLYKLNKQLVFNYVSGVGTDTSEKGRTRWARVKGRTENTILKMGFKDAYMFRPGAIIPMKGIKSKTRIYQFMYDYFLWLIRLSKVVFPNSIVNTSQVGDAMINSVIFGYHKKIIDPKDIIELALKH